MTLRAKYRSPLRESHAKLTRERILDGVGTVIRNDSIDSVTFAAVAAASGVQDRTVFRYFATRELLLKAFWEFKRDKSGIQHLPHTLDEICEWPRRAFPRFDEDPLVMRALFSAPHPNSDKKNVERQEAFRHALAQYLVGLSARDQRRLCATVHLLYGPMAWMVMTDSWGMSGEEAGETAAWAIRSLLAQLGAERAGDSPPGHLQEKDSARRDPTDG